MPRVHSAACFHCCLLQLSPHAGPVLKIVVPISHLHTKTHGKIGTRLKNMCPIGPTLLFSYMQQSNDKVVVGEMIHPALSGSWICSNSVIYYRS